MKRAILRMPVAGLIGAALGAALLLIIFAIHTLMRTAYTAPVSFDLSRGIRRPIFWLVEVVSSAIGVFWQYRKRASR
jgi:cell division protein FtsX